jgi:hypothetical protein
VARRLHVADVEAPVAPGVAVVVEDHLAVERVESFLAVHAK